MRWFQIITVPILLEYVIIRLGLTMEGGTVQASRTKGKLGEVAELIMLFIMSAPHRVCARACACTYVHTRTPVYTHTSPYFVQDNSCSLI